jgi:hypothetical protein
LTKIIPSFRGSLTFKFNILANFIIVRLLSIMIYILTKKLCHKMHKKRRSVIFFSCNFWWIIDQRFLHIFILINIYDATIYALSFIFFMIFMISELMHWYTRLIYDPYLTVKKYSYWKCWSWHKNFAMTSSFFLFFCWDMTIYRYCFGYFFISIIFILLNK